ncbi:GTP-binding protein gtr2, partial [Dimargaris cristalligena]
ALDINSAIGIEVLIHKLDSQTIQFKTQIQRMFEMYVQDEDYESNLSDTHVSYHVTSIFNCSIHIALSKIIQKLVPQAATFESLLSSFLAKSESHQVYLVDLTSRLYFAKDNVALDPDFYELVIHYNDLMEEIMKQQRRDIRGSPGASSSTGLVEMDDGLVLSYIAVSPLIGIFNVFSSTSMTRFPIIEYNLQSLRKSLVETLDYQDQQLDAHLNRFRTRHPMSPRSSAS